MFTNSIILYYPRNTFLQWQPQFQTLMFTNNSTIPTLGWVERNLDLAKVKEMKQQQHHHQQQQQQFQLHSNPVPCKQNHPCPKLLQHMIIQKGPPFHLLLHWKRATFAGWNCWTFQTALRPLRNIFGGPAFCWKSRKSMVSTKTWNMFWIPINWNDWNSSARCISWMPL